MRTLNTGKGAMLTRVGASAVLALTAVGALGSASFGVVTVTQTALSLSSSTGSSTGGGTITLTLPSTASPKFTNTFVGVQFQATTATAAATATCSTNPATTTQVTATGTLRYISATKVSVVVPDLTTITASSSYVLLCAYNAAQASGTIPTTATVVGKAPYIVATAPTLTTTVVSSGVITTSPVVPASGPAVGGQLVTISGTGFPTSITSGTPLTATLGGLPLTIITPVSANSFTAVTPSRPASSTSVMLSVTTAGGTVTSNLGSYVYRNGLTVSPNTVPSGVAVDVDVQGTGFSTLTFSGTTGSSPSDSAAHVYLLDGTYDATGYIPSGAGSALKTTGPATECVNVAVISDQELICTVDATRKLVGAVVANTSATYTYTASNLPNGNYTVTVVNSGASTAPTYQTVLSSAASFTVADF